MLSDSLYVFGDQSLELLPSIRQLTKKCRQNHSLKWFMRAATDAIQSALLTVPAHIRPTVSSFDSPLQLAQAFEPDSRPASLASSLLTIVQLGEFIVYLTSHPCALDGSQPSPVILGVCIGSVSAAAVAASRNLTEFLQIAPQIVVLSFNIGLEAGRRSSNLEPAFESWSTVIKDANPEEVKNELASFNNTLNDWYHRRAYISAVGETSVTISGPPSVTQELFHKNTTLSKKSRLSLPVNVAYHASHLSPISHAKLFDRIDMRIFRKRLRHTLLSSCSARFYQSQTLDDVLHEIADEILQQPIEWGRVAKDMQNIISSSARVTSIGPFAATSTFAPWLSAHEDQGDRSGVTDGTSQPLREGSGSIAIVGMSIRVPGGETLEEFWDILQKGKDLHQEIPLDRFDARIPSDVFGETDQPTHKPCGVLLDRPGHFDPRFFNMSPREAYQTDPQQRLMLLTTYEALENAGYTPNRTPSSNTRRISSFMGQASDDYREASANENIDTHFVTGNVRAFGPGRLNYHFGWEGSSFSIDTACSSSCASIQLACSGLLARECDTAVCGGANLLVSPDLFNGLDRGGFLAKAGGCKTFDEEADGYVRGEACGVIVLKRLEDALAERDNVLAVIRGATTNHSADAVSITHPHGETQERLFRTVLERSGILPHQIDLAELHGTGTQAGDVVESNSVTNVLCQGRGIDHPLILSTVKPNVGHGEAASGITSIIKAVLMLQKRMIPPHIGIKNRVNRRITVFDRGQAKLCYEQTSFEPRADGDGKRRILVNNFDAAGGNTSMLLEDLPQVGLLNRDERSRCIVSLSGKSASSLANNARSLLRWLKQHSDVRIEDLAYTTTARRMHYKFRKAYVAQSVEDLIMQLEDVAFTRVSRRLYKQPSTVFCFTGQGSRCFPIATALYESHSTYRDLIGDYANICVSQGLPTFLPMFTGQAVTSDCPVQEQLALVAAELALAFLWESWGVQASAVVGHSLGEYVALCFARVISPFDCFHLVGKRANLIVDNCIADAGAMLAVQASETSIKEYLDHLNIRNIEFACFNSSKSVVLSGPSTEIENLDKLLKAVGLASKILPTRYAFHSAQMDVILNDFGKSTQAVHFAKPRCPIASSWLGEVINEEDLFEPEYLKSQTRGPVKYEAAISELLKTSTIDEHTVWIEVGPDSTCLGMFKAIKNDAGVLLPSLGSARDDWQVLSTSVATSYEVGLNIDWQEFHRPFEHNLRLVELPSYCFDLKNCWIYRKPNTEVRGMNRPATMGGQHIVHPHLFSPTTCLHRIEKDESDAEIIKLTFATVTSEPAFMKVIQGHLVNRVALCSSSVYAEMAFRIADYIRNQSGIRRDKIAQIDDMAVTKPLVVRQRCTNQTIYVVATQLRTTPDIQLQYCSQEGFVYQIHATCVVHFNSEPQLLSGLFARAEEVREKAIALREAALEGKVHTLLRPMVYKLFRSFVDYDQHHQGLAQVLLNTAMLEATANVRFRQVDGSFTQNPYWIDSIAHIAGFVLNGSEFTPDGSVFISHGWKSFKLLRPLSSNKDYQSYVRMQPSQRPTVLTGNVYLLDGHGIAAIFEDLEFQQVQRGILEYLIPSTQTATLQAATQHQRFFPPPDNAGDSPKKSKLSKRANNKTTNAGFEPIPETVARDLVEMIPGLEEKGIPCNQSVDNLMAMNSLSTLRARDVTIIPTSTLNDRKSIKKCRTQSAANPKVSTMPSNAAFAGCETMQQHLNPGKSELSTYSIDFSRILVAIAQELDVDVFELQDDVVFADLGVDSLLAISIISRLSALLDQKLPATLLIHHPCVADLRLYFRASCSQHHPPDVTNLSQSSAVPAGDIKAVGQSIPRTAGPECYIADKLSHRVTMTETIRRIVAEEVGTRSKDVEDDVPLAELGVDSLLWLSIMTRVRKQTGIILASTMIADNLTVSTIESVLRSVLVSQHAVDVKPTESYSWTPPHAQFVTRSEADLMGTKIWGASSVLLQESQQSKKPCLFLLPDGSGSPSSYTGLPHLESIGAVYGLTSPYMTDPDHFHESLQALVIKYVEEILRIQPAGPYHIGGWSIGGICAFEAASQLIRRHGQEVASLVLIDAPCPTIFPPLPVEDIDFLQSIGILETLRPSRTPECGVSVTCTQSRSGLLGGIYEHFAGSIRALAQYRAEAIEESKAPKLVTLLWARHGVWRTVDEDSGLSTAVAARKNQHPTTSWLMDTRASFETCGWEELLPGSNFTCHTIDGDHFSMMREPGVVTMGAKISLPLT